MDFPIYRMLVNKKVFYKINHLREFEEIQLIGSKLRYHKMLASQYPEYLTIQAMINQDPPIYLEMEEAMWLDYFNRLDSLPKDL